MACFPGSDGATVEFSIAQDKLQVEYCCPGRGDWEWTVFVVLRTGGEAGSAVVPFSETFEGSTVFLPFQANQIYRLATSRGSSSISKRTWENWRWEDPREAGKELDFEVGACDCRIRLSLQALGQKVKVVLYSKDFTEEKTWGRFFGASDPSVGEGAGDKYIPHYLEIDLQAKDRPVVKGRKRSGPLRIYQLFVRLFGNANETRKENGTLAENGVGKFNDINDAALVAIRGMGFSHIWLTGVLQQASGTDYRAIGEPADDPDLLKGIAGSPYSIKDYFDVCPDYAIDPKERLTEFKDLLDRLHKHGLKVLIDFVPNHVARCYHSDIKPEINFGTTDDRAKFFDPRNNFFYLQPDADGPPLKLPTWQEGVALSPTCKLEGMECDGRFEGELDHGKATGNNVASWKPNLNDWYETAKLNYGFDFTDPAGQRREYPNAWHPEAPVPDTWKKMDQVIAYWQEMGVDGFRGDMAHMEPPEFWKWLIARARQRMPDVVFIGEAYDNDPAKVPGSDPVLSRLSGGRGNVMFDLLDAGFDGVYDDPTYRELKRIYEGPAWANDLDTLERDAFIFDNSLRYAENHDEVRLAAPSQWGGVGLNVGRPVTAILYALSRGATMLYNGQEVGEPAAGAEGFGGDDSRTSLFDYWSMPALVRWSNGHRYDGGKLSLEEQSLREFYTRLVRLTNQPAFQDGVFIPLNPANKQNPAFGRLGNETTSGHWCYAFLRFNQSSRQTFLVVVNLHPREALRHVGVFFPRAALQMTGLNKGDFQMRLTDRLAAGSAMEIE
ncbi:MAG TPA: alpha-amylase family glycosyl hydrolase, partial [Chthoniobacteraceae bacterium]|nr:alpha-amylase family glycosyl hydrolase [Chthoniobacteraceae bacterium]